MTRNYKITLKNLTMVILLVTSQMAFAFNSDDEQIDYVLDVIKSGSQAEKEKVLERLQWSTISDARLYDVLANELVEKHTQSLESAERRVLSYKVRALGYSGNPKYESTLDTLVNNTVDGKLRRHAEKAWENLITFKAVQTQLEKVEFEQGELPSEVANYIRLLKTNDSYAKRLAARATFHEHQTNQVLLSIIAEQLKAAYKAPDLEDLDQDMAAWFCKALGQAGGYGDLLSEVADNSPYRKIQKYAKQF